jgi:hypothetical protein
MQPHAPLVVDLHPHELSADAVKPLFLPWSGQHVTIRVPAGTPDGTVLRIPGLGYPAVLGGPPQDGYVQVRVIPAAEQFGPPPAPYSPVAYPPPPAPYGPVGPVVPVVPAKGLAAGATRRNTFIGTAVVLVLLVGCCAISRSFSDDEPEAGPASRPLAGAPAPGTAPAAPDAYQAALTKADTTLAARLRTLGTATSPKSVRSSTDGLQSAVDEQRAALAAVAPPVPVADAHRDLVAALAALGASLTGDDVGKACLGPAATSSLGRTPAADDLRAVSKALSTADPARAYTFGSFVPKQSRAADRRLANGTFVSRATGGPGRLEITNGGDDSLVSMVRKGARKSAVRVYLRGGKTFTVTGIADGTYQVFMTNGADWDPKLRAFGRNCAFQKFDDTIKFTSSGGAYSVWKITITAVVGGNASSSDVDPDAFPN